MGADSTPNRFAAIDELFDICSRVLTDKDYDTSSDKVLNAPSAIACVLTGNGSKYKVLFEQNKNVVHSPASMSKMLTLLTALDYIKDLDEEITIKEYDVTRGSGCIFYAGDKVRYRDLFYALMLPSSNTAATAIARNVGKLV